MADLEQHPPDFDFVVARSAATPIDPSKLAAIPTKSSLDVPPLRRGPGKVFYVVMALVVLGIVGVAGSQFLPRLARPRSVVTIPPLADDAARVVATEQRSPSRLARPIPPPSAGHDDTPVVSASPDPEPNREPDSEPGNLDRGRTALDATEAVVTIEVGGSSRLRVVGAGFFVQASRPVVVTSLHVARQLVSGDVRLDNGTRYEIAGYAAIAADQDLAVLDLVSPPVPLPTIELASKLPAPRSRIWSIGQPERCEGAVLPGRVVDLVSLADLPDHSRQFVRDTLAATGVPLWLRHDTRLSGGSSGGPVLDEAGAVVGVNAFIDESSGLAYAVPVGQVAALLERLPARTVPLVRYVQPSAVGRDDPGTLTVATIHAVRERLRTHGWTPEDEDDYRAFCDLAAWITLASVAPDALGPRGAERDEDRTALLDELDQIDRELRGSPWTVEQIPPINDLAAGVWDRGDRGWFFIGTVERLVRGERGRRGAFVKLTGGGPEVFVRFDQLLTTPRVGGHYLILGWQNGDDEVRFGDNPLAPQAVPEIVSGAWIEW